MLFNKKNGNFHVFVDCLKFILNKFNKSHKHRNNIKISVAENLLHFFALYTFAFNEPVITCKTHFPTIHK